MSKEVLFRIQNLKQYFPVKKSGIGKRKKVLYVRANDDVSLDIYKGETFGLVGESGCGKSTLGRTMLQLYKQTDGRTIFYGESRFKVNPKYVYDILDSMYKDYEGYLKLYEEVEELKKEADSMEESEEKFFKMNEYIEKEKEYRLGITDIIQITGALVLHSDTKKVKDALLKEQKLKAMKNSTSKKDKKDIPLDLDKQISDVEKELNELREQVKENPNFEKYEEKRDIGVNLAKLTYEEMRGLRKNMQLIFQDPYSSLNPTMTVAQIISEGLVAHNLYKRNSKELNDYVQETMQKSGLAPYFVHRYPHQFSGGQRQRIGIARSVALKPEFIVCDEAVSALDVSIQSQIINLLLDLKEQENLTYLFISHDLSVVKYISDRIGVMYLGNLVELSSKEALFERPLHPYTEALLSAIPTTDSRNKEIEILEGDIPSPINPPKGCKFHTRCKYATEICKNVAPTWEEIDKDHFVACHHYLGKGE